MTPEQLTKADFANFVTIERVCSALSLLGCTFIAVTFLGSRAFHKPINRLVFFASMGNVFTNVATLISRSAVGHANGSLCQFQAFLIQMFMPADAYWTLAMAVNVYLTFYWKFDAEALRKLEKYYFMICYGAPFIPAFVYIWLKTEHKGHLYGNATLWCWVAAEWDVMRIYTFYGPVWLVILLTMLIYTRAGREIYAKRSQLRNFNVPAPQPLPIISDPFQSVKTTEVYVTSESIEETQSRSVDPHLTGPTSPPAVTKNAYTVTVSSPQPLVHNKTRYSFPENSLQAQDERKGSDANPSVTSQIPTYERRSIYPTRRYAAMEANNAAWSYTKVAVLFFVAMMVTWIPSSANRVYSVVHPGHISLGLEYASAFVLPLQGFWNALIYATTSLNACRHVWTQIRDRKRSSNDSFSHISGVFNEGGDGRQKQQGHRNKLYTETDSMTELASRADTNGSSV